MLSSRFLSSMLACKGSHARQCSLAWQHSVLSFENLQCNSPVLKVASRPVCLAATTFLSQCSPHDLTLWSTLHHTWACAELVLKGNGEDSLLTRAVLGPSIAHLCSQWSSVPTRFWSRRKGWRLQEVCAWCCSGCQLDNACA